MSDDWEEGFALDETEPPLPAPDEENVCWPGVPPRRIRSKFYVWGYGLPQTVMILRQFHETEEARHFAAARGWDATRTGAWAKEIELPMSMSRAYQALAPELRLDTSVVGCGGRKVSEGG